MGLLLGCSTSRGVIRAGPGLVVPSRALKSALFVAAQLSDALSNGRQPASSVPAGCVLRVNKR